MTLVSLFIQFQVRESKPFVSIIYSYIIQSTTIQDTSLQAFLSPVSRRPHLDTVKSIRFLLESLFHRKPSLNLRDFLIQGPQVPPPCSSRF